MLFKLSKDKKQMDVIVSYLRQLSKDCVVEVRDPHRTHDQNALFWVNLEILADHAGYEKEEMNCVIKKSITTAWKLNMWHEKRGKVTVDVYKSTADLTVKE